MSEKQRRHGRVIIHIRLLLPPDLHDSPPEPRTVQQVLTRDNNCHSPCLSHTWEKQVSAGYANIFSMLFFSTLTWPGDIGLSLDSAPCVQKMPVLVHSPAGKNKEECEIHNSTCTEVQIPDPVLVCFLFKL